MSECVICNKLKEKQAIIVYEDESTIAILPTKPAALGHIKIFPKKHATKLEELEDSEVESLFFLANFSSASVFEIYQAHGTNIILNESDKHLCIDIIPRKENDELNFMWQPTQLQPQEMDEVHKKIADKIGFVPSMPGSRGTLGGSAPAPSAPPVAPVKKEPEKIVSSKDKENYLIKQLERLP